MAVATPTPLTTIFSPPAACFTDLYLVPENAVWLGPGTQCIHDGPNPTLSQYFSPGIYCPSGYTVACSTQVNIGSFTQSEATCCPQIGNVNGIRAAPFSCQTEHDYPWYSTFGCTLGFDSAVNTGPFTFTYTTNGTTALSTMTYQPGFGINAYSVQLAWQASDLLTTTTSVAQSTSLSSSGTSGPGVVTVTAEPTSSAGQDAHDSNNAGLSATAKIAIGVVVPAVVLLGLAIGVFLLMRRTKNPSRDRPAYAATPGIFHDDKPELYSGTGRSGAEDTQALKHEMDGDYARPTFHELGSMDTASNISIHRT